MPKNKPPPQFFGALQNTAELEYDDVLGSISTRLDCSFAEASSRFDVAQAAFNIQDNREYDVNILEMAIEYACFIDIESPVIH